MPNIAEYTAQSNLEPSDRGIQAAEIAGRRIGLFYHQLGSDVKDAGDAVEQHMSVMEASELYKTGTQLRINLQQRYDQESALPQNRDDPHFGDRFMAEVSPLLDKWQSSAATPHGKELAVTLGSDIRNDIFNHVAAGQSEMDSAHVEDNATQTMNSLGAGLITDPSETNLDRSIGTAREAIQGMTMAIPDVGTRERVATELEQRYVPQLVLSRYNGVAESIKNQIAQTGEDTSPALEQMNKDLAGQVGFQYLSPEEQSRLTEVRDDAVRQGQELFKSRDATAKSQAIEKGRADYALIDTSITDSVANGKPLNPDQIAAIDKYSQVYGATNPAEVHALNDARLRAQEDAQSGKYETFNPQAWADIQGRITLPSIDPRAVTNTTLMQAWGAHQISTEQLKLGKEIIETRDKQPNFTPGWEALQRWQNYYTSQLGPTYLPGMAAVKARVVHDSSVIFMSRIHKGDDAIDAEAATAKAFEDPSWKTLYQRAANIPGGKLPQLPNIGEDGSIALGSTHAPILSTAKAPPAGKLDQGKVDSIIWGGK